MKANVLRLPSPTDRRELTAFQPASSAQRPCPAPPALGPRVPHTWSNFLERLWRLLFHLISGHNTLVKGVCERTEHLSILKHRKPAGDRENGWPQRLTCPILRSPFHTEHCTQPGGDSHRRENANRNPVSPWPLLPLSATPNFMRLPVLPGDLTWPLRKTGLHAIQAHSSSSFQCPPCALSQILSVHFNNYGYKYIITHAYITY